MSSSTIQQPAVGHPWISVIMPVYNGEAFLSRAIESLQKQTEADWELLAVDDGSTDKSYSILAECAASDPRIQVLRHSSNRGLSAARNTALTVARGTHIAYLDCDDEFYADHLKRAWEWRNRGEVLVFRYDLIEERPGNSAFGQITTYDPANNLRQMVVDTLAVPLGVIHRRDLLEKCGAFNEKLGRHRGITEDADLWRRFARAGALFAFVPHQSGLYHIRADSLSRTQLPLPNDLLNSLAPSLHEPIKLRIATSSGVAKPQGVQPEESSPLLPTNPYDTQFFHWQQEGSYRSAQEVIPLVLELLAPKSAVDFGCGVGGWLKILVEHGVTDILGLDGDYVTVDQLCIDPTRFQPTDLTRCPVLERQFDLAICLEVAEHLPPESASQLVDALVAASPCVLFSAALPGQGGRNHVNEAWPYVWNDLFARHGYCRLDPIRPRIWRNSAVEWWYKQNIYLYVSEGAIQANPALRQEQKMAQDFPFELIHQKVLRQKISSPYQSRKDPDVNNKPAQHQGHRDHQANPSASIPAKLVTVDTPSSSLLPRPNQTEATKPRVLFASYHCFHDPSSGAALCTRDLFDLLAVRGWSCGVATGPRLDFNRSGTIGELLAQETGVECLQGHADEGSFQIYNWSPRGYPISFFVPNPPSAQRLPSLAEARAFLSFLDRIISKFQPDIVLTYGGDLASSGVIDLARRRGVKVAFWLHNTAYHSIEPFRKCHAVVVPSESSREYYQNAIGLESTVLPGPWNPKHFLCADRQPTYVTFVNPEPYKGVFWFARLAQVLGQARSDIPFLVVEGRGGIDWLGQCGVDLSQVSSVHRMKNTTDARQFYQVTRLLLAPSYCREGMMRVVVEGLLNGIPVMGSGRGGMIEGLCRGGIHLPIPECYTPETRQPPPAEEVKPWVEAIINLWDNDAAYQQASQVSRDGSRVWSPEELIPRWEEWLTQLAAK